MELPTYYRLLSGYVANERISRGLTDLTNQIPSLLVRPETMCREATLQFAHDTIGGVRRAGDRVLSVPNLLESLGGEFETAWARAHVRNTCVIRMSQAFNRAGQAHLIPNRTTARSYPLAVMGGDNDLWYAMRVREFKPFLATKYSSEIITVTKHQTSRTDLTQFNADNRQTIHTTTAAHISKSHFNGYSGVICFEYETVAAGTTDGQSSGATGHFTLWDGTQCIYGDYFNRSASVHLFLC